MSKKARTPSVRGNWASTERADRALKSRKRKPFKQAEGTDDPQARHFQKRLRLTIANFAATQIEGDDLMMISGVMTECVAATFELLNRYNYAPTEEQFVELWSRSARGVARGEHIAGAHKEGGNA